MTWKSLSKGQWMVSLFVSLLAILHAGCSSGVDPAADDDSSAEEDGTGGSRVEGSGGSEGSNPDPTLCGGGYDDPCAAGKVCVFGDGCGTVGHCTRVPSGCDDVFEPVCGCDGTTYGNACEALLAGVSPQADAACSAGVPFVPCGEFSCEPGVFCLDKGEEETGERFACLTVPDSCAAAPDCACLKEETKACFQELTCSETSGAFTVVCL